MSWYVDQESKNREQFENEITKPRVNRFWLKSGATREIIFLDDTRFGVHEHRVKISDSWEPYTCSGEDCAFCLYKKTKSYSEFYTILDLTPWKGKDGKEVKFSRRLLAVGKNTADILTKRREDLGGSLFGKRFKVSRLGDKAVSCGNDWSAVPTQKTLDLAKLPENLQPLDFKKILKPLSKTEMMRILMARSFLEAPVAEPAISEEELPF